MEKVAKVFKNINQQKRIYSNFGNKTYPLSNLHLTSTQNYPVAEPLPIPANVDPAETTKFSPQRARDITHNHMISHQSNSLNSRSMDITLDSSNNDPHIESYDCHGAVNLNSAMQSNVPQPFGGLNKFTHLNMPGGQWGQESKFMSQNLQSSHYTALRSEARSAWSKYDENATTEKEG